MKATDDLRKQTDEGNQKIDDKLYQAVDDPKQPYWTTPKRKDPVPYLNYAPLQNANAMVKKSAEAFTKAYGAATAEGKALPAEQQRQLNAILLKLERALTSKEGLPRRPWHVHQLDAPGAYTGYGARPSRSARGGRGPQLEEAGEQIEVVAKTLRGWAAQVDARDEAPGGAKWAAALLDDVPPPAPAPGDRRCGRSTVLTVAFLRPTPERMAHAFLPDRGDPVFNLYVLSWGIHQFEQGLPGYWDANVFYPTPKALTLSDHLIGPAAFGWALSPLVPNPIVVYNLLVLASFVVTGAATCWVLRRSGVSFPGALLASCGYAFSAFRWTHLNHIQVLLMGLIPLVLWSFDRLLAERNLRWALAFLAVYPLHLSGGAYLHDPLPARGPLRQSRRLGGGEA
jgi:hypothetical protein